MFGIGAQELAIILVVALLVFGPKRLPELARTLGRGLAEFRRASTDLRQSIQLDAEPERPPKPDIQAPSAATPLPETPAEDPTPEPGGETQPAAEVAPGEAKEPAGG